MHSILGSAIAGFACATLLASSANASMIYETPTHSMAADRSLSLDFNSGLSTSGFSFFLDAFPSRDSKNIHEHGFSTNSNGNPFEVRISNGFGIGWDSGKEDPALAVLISNAGLKAPAFAFLGRNDANLAGFQSLGGEGEGVARAEVSATPLPPAWTMMLIGLACFGWIAGYLRRKQRSFAVA